MKRRSFGKKKTPKLGQHFLTSAGPARALARAVQIAHGDTVVEIGPGEGALTRELLTEGARVIAIEKDRELVAKLGEIFPEEIASGALRVVEDDIRNVKLEALGLTNGGYALAANIPYYITGEIIRMFLSTHIQPHSIALLVQKEVAQRIVANKESILSISVKAYGIPKIVSKVSRGNFSPPPSVDSAILLISCISKDRFKDLDEKHFFKIVRAGFSSKRKLLSGNLSNLGYAKLDILRAFSECNIKENARAEELSVEKWKSLASRLSGITARDLEQDD